MGNFTIYLRRNKVNGKCYVGQTNDFDRRENEWKRLNHYYANEHICNDRAKYGLDNWTVETLAEVDNREDAWELEQRFINDYNTLWPNGYNITKGGGGANGVHPSNETRRKLSEAKTGEKHPMYGKHPSDETIQKISKSNLNNEKQSKQVYQYTLDGTLVRIWPSTRECGRNGFSRGNISMCCNGKQKTHMGYKWSNIQL